MRRMKKQLSEEETVESDKRKTCCWCRREENARFLRLLARQPAIRPSDALIRAFQDWGFYFYLDYY
jgi:hypothetical protein